MEFKISDKMRNMKPSIIREILKQMSDPTLISFAGGNPAADSFPAEDIARFSDELLRQDPVAALQYSVSEGVPSVREAVRAFANRRERVAKENDGVLITSGSQQILDFAAKCLCNEGDVVAVENPAFLGAFNAFRSSGARLAGVPMEDDGVNLAALEAVFAAPEKPRFFLFLAILPKARAVFYHPREFPPAVNGGQTAESPRSVRTERGDFFVSPISSG